jgi:hypothetical protein
VKFGRASLLAVAAFLLLAAGFVPVGLLQARAQNIGQRVVVGKVFDSNSAAVAGATVFLKNLKTKSIRSYTTTEDGRFRFTQVNMADDFDLWAEKAERKSPTKSVSSWDSRKEFQAELRMK